MATTTEHSFNLGLYEKNNKNYFIETTNMIELKLYKNGH
jgi:hypothetical protein